MSKPQVQDFPPYFGRYISQADAESLSEAIEKYAPLLIAFYVGLPEEKATFSYAKGKWSLKELLLHVIDTERVMAYRLLRFVRKDKTPLASFDENLFAANSLANDRSFGSIKEEFVAVRKSTDLLIQSLSEEQLKEKGMASNLSITANAIGYIIFGHMLHHKMVVEEKYLAI